MHVREHLLVLVPNCNYELKVTNRYVGQLVETYRQSWYSLALAEKSSLVPYKLVNVDGIEGPAAV